MAAMATLKIVLCDIKPPIWRRIEVPTHFTLAQLHIVLQGVMGWRMTHLHCFELGGARYDVTAGDDFDWGMPHRDEREFTLAELLKPEMSFDYLYDFGDDWYHKIVVEKIEPVEDADEDELWPICLDGNRATPPEDCGGPFGYAELLDILKNKKHPRHAELAAWTGKFDPAVFSVPQANSLIYALLALDEARAAAEKKPARSKRQAS